MKIGSTPITKYTILRSYCSRGLLIIAWPLFLVYISTLRRRYNFHRRKRIIRKELVANKHVAINSWPFFLIFTSSGEKSYAGWLTYFELGRYIDILKLHIQWKGESTHRHVERWVIQLSMSSNDYLTISYLLIMQNMAFYALFLCIPHVPIP